MRIIKFKKVTILKIFIVISFITVLVKMTTSFGMQHYYNVDFSTGIVKFEIVPVTEDKISANIPNDMIKDNNQMRYGHFGTYFDYGYEQFLRKGNNNNNYFNNYSSNLNNNLSNYKYNGNNNIYTNYPNNYY